MTLFENKELRDAYYQLSEIADKESIKLWRLARKMREHGCSYEICKAVKDEAWELYHECKSNPKRLLDVFKTWNYAFRF